MKTLWWGQLTVTQNICVVTASQTLGHNVKHFDVQDWIRYWIKEVTCVRE